MSRRPSPLALRACLLLLAVPACASAGGPVNDDWADRQVVASLPFSDIEGAIGAATLEASDPVFACRRTAPTVAARSVWYSYTTGAATEYVNASATGFDSLVAIYAGDVANGFTLVTGACNDDGGGTNGPASLIGIRLEPDTEYSIEVATWDANVPATVLQLTVDRARTFLVTKAADTNDGTCDGDCSVREAVRAANQGEGAVIVPAGTYALGLAGTGDDANLTGDLDLLGSAGVYGAGTSTTIIEGTALASGDRVLHLDPAGVGSFSFAIADLTLRNGRAADGAALANIGGAANPDFVGLSQVRITGSVATAQGGGARLDGISLVEDSTIDANTAATDGGGLAATAAASRLTIARSTLAGNASQRTSAGGGGGGVYLSAGTHVIDNATLSGNTARGGGGGAMLAGSAAVAIADATIVGNRADALGSSGQSGGGVRLEGTGSASFANSIVATNVRGAGTAGSDCSRAAPVVLTSHDDLVQVPETCTFSGSNDVAAVAPGLGPLAANGGPTQTHAPLAGSAVVETGAPTCGRVDQRGIKRPLDGDGNGVERCDRGAFEAADPVLFRNGFE